MEICLKNADFSANAVTKLSAGIKEFVNGAWMATGKFSANNKFVKSTITIEITQAMREKGFVINNVSKISTDYYLVLFFSGTPSSETLIEGSINNNFTPFNQSFYRVYPEMIPDSANYFIVNTLIDNDDTVVYDDYFIELTTINTQDGYVTADGSYVSDSTFQCSQQIPVSSGNFVIKANYMATYDNNEQFIERITLNNAFGKEVQIGNTVRYIKIMSTAYMYLEF